MHNRKDFKYNFSLPKNFPKWHLYPVLTEYY